MDFTDFIHEFEQKTGLSNLVIDADNHTAFTADGIPVHMLYLIEFDVLLVFSELVDIPPTANEGLYRALLELNYLFEGTQGATLAKEPGSEKLFLTEKILNFRSFSLEDIVELLGRLVDGSEKLIHLLENYRGTTEKSGNSTNPEDVRAFFNSLRV